ncbi:MAG TPA: response regulator transcription factor [Chthonomonadaceae bacterium]|nr:response regulator transcription factor [Chthonomonadaceae bacterium]
MSAADDTTNNAGRIPVLLVDDHAGWRAGMRNVLANTEFTVVGEAASGEAAVEVARQAHPRLTLLDIRMAGGDGFETLTALKTLDPKMVVIMLTTYENLTFKARAVAGGASGYLLKGATHQEILRALRTAAGGEALLSAQDLLHALRGISEQVVTSPHLVHPLTSREMEVLQLVATGLSNKDIARILSIGEGTTKSHVEHILQKLHLTDRVHVAVWAARYGFTSE